MLTVFSLLDERSRPLGSRDPLAIESVWSFVGRKLVGNLTTITSNINHFIVALLACRHAHDGGASRSLEDVQQRYVRAEQVAAYLRLSQSEDTSLLGKQLALANFRRGRMPLGMTRKAQILSNQLSYGMWGLYSSALQAAGLIKGAERMLTANGVVLTDRLLEAFGEKQWHRFQQLTRADEINVNDLRLLAPQFVGLLRNKAMRADVALALLRYSRAEPLQINLYECVQSWVDTRGDGSSDVRQFLQWALSSGRSQGPLREVLSQVSALQPVLVFANSIVVWLQSQKGRTRDALAVELQPLVSKSFLPLTWESPGLPQSTFLKRLCDAANNGDAAAVIDHVIEQNSHVMKRRGGAAWLHWEGGVLRVRVPVGRAILRNDLPAYCQQAWEYSFFLSSFISIAKAGLR